MLLFKNPGERINQSVWLILMAVVMQGIISSCHKDDEILPQTNPQTSGQLNTMMELGKQLKNPYSVENMRKAINELRVLSNKSSAANIDFPDIQTTHLYVKFKPKNDDELSILKQDSTLILYDYPLDYEIKQDGAYYRDPEVPQDQPTYQYASVKAGKKLPEEIEHEVLSELYYVEKTEESDTPQKSGANIDGVDWFALEQKALEITDNLEKEVEEKQKDKSPLDEQSFFFRRRRSWRPKGRIQVWDNTLGRYVGVEGVEVRARRWFWTSRGLANAKGYYRGHNTFTRPATYRIIWERHHFEIRSAWLIRAKYWGPRKKGDWNLKIRSGVQQYYANIFRAAYHYYYKNIKGLRRPPLNGFRRNQLKIRAYNRASKSGNYLGLHAPHQSWWLGSNIEIFNDHGGITKSLYGTVIHELAHAAHWNMGRRDYNRADIVVAESWANGVEWELTRMVYSTYVPWYNRLAYTGIVQDMIDGTKTTTSSSYYESRSKPFVYSEKSYSDKVSGYTIRQLEDALRGKRTWNDWRDNIKNKYNNGTENHLDAAFSFWNTK